MSYDRMVAALQEDKAFVPPTTVDILVSTLGHRMLLKEKLALVKDLWSAGLRADIAHNATWVRSFFVFGHLCNIGLLLLKSVKSLSLFCLWIMWS